MKNMSSLALSVLLVISIALLSLGKVAAQEEETYEGFIHGIRANAVEGEAFYQRNEAKFALEPGLNLEPGDIIKTGPAARAELLLQPGNYLRAAADTELQIINDQHDTMKLKLNRGTVSFEILSRESLNRYDNDSEARDLIRLITPGTEVFISHPGIFRVNTTQPGQTELIALNGSAVVKGHEVKQKRRAVVSGNDIRITDVDSKIEDAFDAWARERAGTLIQANKALKKTSPWAKKQREGREASVDMPHDEERSSSPLVVSAKPGTVNFVEEGVEFSRKPNEWQQVTEKTHLETGDRVRSVAHSLAEFMLFPDMHFRLDASSEVFFEQLSNDAVSVKIEKGSAILDVARFDRKETPPIRIATGSTSVTITEAGNYRIDANPEATITVRDGKVTFNGRTVGSCRSIAAGVVSDCDKKHTDNFDYWSRYCGEGEFYRGLSMVNYFAKLRRNRFRNTGFWFQTPGQVSYTFVPFTSELFRSPYGGNYTTVLSPRRRLSPLIDGERRRGFPEPQPGLRQP